jgi:hypothetical protein
MRISKKFVNYLKNLFLKPKIKTNKRFITNTKLDEPYETIDNRNSESKLELLLVEIDNQVYDETKRLVDLINNPQILTLEDNLIDTSCLEDFIKKRKETIF